MNISLLQYLQFLIKYCRKVTGLVFFSYCCFVVFIKLVHFIEPRVIFMILLILE